MNRLTKALIDAKKEKTQQEKELASIATDEHVEIDLIRLHQEQVAREWGKACDEGLGKFFWHNKGGSVSEVDFKATRQSLDESNWRPKASEH